MMLNITFTNSYHWMTSPGAEILLREGDGLEVIKTRGDAVGLSLFCNDSKEGGLNEFHDLSTSPSSIAAYSIKAGRSASVWPREGVYIPTTENSDYLSGLAIAQDYIDENKQ